MEQQNTRLRNVGFITFFFSGICAISSGVVVSLLQEQYGFAYGMTGTLLSLMSIGNLLAGFLIAMLPGKLGMKPSILLLTIGYALGYAMMGLSGAVAVLALGFFLVGIAKGSVINTCTILVSDNSADRTRGMNLMHSCYACGALLCPFFIAAAGRVSGSFAVLVLAVLGLLLWLVYMGTPFAGKGAGKKEVTDWSFLRSTRFWLLTGLLFCQNAAEQSVTGWMVTYFKGSGIIAGALAAYTVTVMWGATLVARLLIAFVFPFKQPRKAMVVMGVSCTIFYILLVQARSQGAAIVLLFAFAFAMAGMSCGQRRPYDQRDQHGHHAAGGGQRRDPDALGHRRRGRKRRSCRRYDDQHRSLRGSGHLCNLRGKASGGIKSKRKAAAFAAAFRLLYSPCLCAELTAAVVLPVEAVFL